MSETSRKFPIGLTIATAIALAILLTLGGWQLKRLAWKEDLLARIETLKTAPAAPINTVLARARRGEAVDWTRVSVTCETPTEPRLPDWMRNGVRDGEMVWRVATVCDLPAGPYGQIIADRGTIDAARGTVEKPASNLPPIVSAVGILAPMTAVNGDTPTSVYTSRGQSPSLMLMIEREDPAPAGVTAAPLPVEISNRHLEYALTWFGLAGALVAVYVALLRRRLKRA